MGEYVTGVVLFMGSHHSFEIPRSRTLKSCVMEWASGESLCERTIVEANLVENIWEQLAAPTDNNSQFD